MKERENFTGKFGFVISCVGAFLVLVTYGYSPTDLVNMEVLLS